MKYKKPLIAAGIFAAGLLTNPRSPFTISEAIQKEGQPVTFPTSYNKNFYEFMGAVEEATGQEPYIYRVNEPGTLLSYLDRQQSDGPSAGIASQDRNEGQGEAGTEMFLTYWTIGDSTT